MIDKISIFDKIIKGLLSKTIEEESINDLVNKIYNYMMENLQVETDTLNIEESSIRVNNPKYSGTINGIKADVAGTYYDLKTVISLLRKYIKQNRGKVFYIKENESKFYLDKPNFLKIQRLVKESISITRLENGDFSYQIENVKDSETVIKDNKKPRYTYIPEEEIKNIIRDTIETYAKGLLKKGLAAGALVSSTLVALTPVNASFESVELVPIKYTLKSNDTLSLIADKYNVSVEEIIKNNPNIKNPDTVFNGQEIVVKYINLTIEEELNEYIDYLSNADSEMFENKDIEKDEKDAKEKDTKKTVSQDADQEKTSKYIIQSGDTMIGLAEKHSITQEELRKLNNMDDNDILMVGQEIVVPKLKKLSLEETLSKYGYAKGIDISHYQGKMDLIKVYKENPINFVILKTFDFCNNYETYEDFDKHVRGLLEIQKRDSSFGVGIYFLPDLRKDNIEEQINKLIKLLDELKSRGLSCNYPIYLDIEGFDSKREESAKKRGTEDAYNIISKAITKENLIMKMGGEAGQTFQKFKKIVDMLRNAGYTPGIYSSINGYDYQGYRELAEYAGITQDFYWVAQYNYNNLHINNVYAPRKDCGMHQQSEGILNGYVGQVDVNSVAINYPELIRNSKYNNHLDEKSNNISYENQEKNNNTDKKTEATEVSVEQVIEELENTYKFTGDNVIYENGLINIDAGEIAINVESDINLNELKKGQSIEIADVTGKVYTITKTNQEMNKFVIFGAGFTTMVSYILAKTCGRKSLINFLITNRDNLIKNQEKGLK